MNFEKAHQELMQGKNIRRKNWEPLMYLAFMDGEMKAFRGEHSHFYGGLSLMMSSGWTVKDGNGKRLTFIEALEELKNKKWITHEGSGNNRFIFVDGDELAICTAVEYEFLPSFKDFCANDWEIMK